jgi:hypothetical protein
MSETRASFQGTPNGFTDGARGFKPYRGGDVKQGKGGYVQVSVPRHGKVWATLYESGSVELLGWGKTNGGDLSDYSESEQEALKTTL